ncbi:MFS transporter, partial [Paraburkholderia sp. SIMBA_049]
RTVYLSYAEGGGAAFSVIQMLVPMAAAMAPEAQRGRAVGNVMSGLMLGILLSRVVAGFVAETAGWRAMFALAAASVAAIGIVAARGLPRFEPTTRLSYRALIGSLGELWRRHPALRR